MLNKRRDASEAVIHRRVGGTEHCPRVPFVLSAAVEVVCSAAKLASLSI